MPHAKLRRSAEKMMRLEMCFTHSLSSLYLKLSRPVDAADEAFDYFPNDGPHQASCELSLATTANPIVCFLVLPVSSKEVTKGSKEF